MLAVEAQNNKGFKFVWFTDGAGWKSARQNLRETYEVLPTMFNIKELEDGVMSSIFI
jgi:type II restriction enzyme